MAALPDDSRAGPCRLDDPDAGLVARALAGDEVAREQIRGKYRDALLKSASEKLHDTEVAGETVDAAFAEAFADDHGFTDRISYFTRLHRLTQSQVARQNAALVAMAQAGDESAFKKLRDRYYGKLKGMTFRMLRNETAARDAVEDAFAAAFISIGKFEGRSDFYTWLYRIAWNKVSKQRAQAKKDSCLVPLEPVRKDADDDPDSASGTLPAPMETEPEFAYQQRQVKVARARDIHELRGVSQEVLYMLLAGLETDEIAGILGTGEANVRKHIREGKDRLKQMREARGERD